MADGVINYRVQIDQSDLGSQLSSVKNQVDTAMETMQFSNPMDAMQGIQNQLNIGLGSMAFNTANTGGFGNYIMNDFAGMAETSANVGSYLRSQIGGISSSLMSGMDTAKLGYRKFTDDLQMLGLTTPPAYANQERIAQLATESYLPRERGFFGNLFASSFGFGYKNDMPINQLEYKDIARKRLGNQVVSGGIDLLDTGLMAGGLLAGSAATGGLGLALMLANGATKLAGFDYTATQNFGAFIQASSKRNLGRINEDESIDTAKYIRELSYDVDVRSKIGNKRDVENLVVEGVNAGLFLNTSNAEEFKQKSEELVKNFRTIQHAMYTTSKEAMQIMSNMESSGMSGGTIEGMRDLALTANVLSQRTGYTPTGMLQIAQQGAEMVRGTGASMRDAARESMRSVALVTSILKSGNYSEEMIRQMGGTDQAGLNLLNLSYSLGNSASGRIMWAAGQQKYNFADPKSTITGMLSAAGTINLADYGTMLDTQYKLNADLTDPNKTNGRLFDQGAFLIKKMTDIGGLSPEDITRERFFQEAKNSGLSSTDAELLTGFWADRGRGTVDNIYKDLAATVKTTLGDQPTRFKRWWSTVTKGVSKAYAESIGEPAAEVLEAEKKLASRISNRDIYSTDKMQQAILLTKKEDFYDPTQKRDLSEAWRYAKETKGGASLFNFKTDLTQIEGISYKDVADWGWDQMWKVASGEITDINGIAITDDVVTNTKRKVKILGGTPLSWSIEAMNDKNRKDYRQARREYKKENQSRWINEGGYVNLKKKKEVMQEFEEDYEDTNKNRVYSENLNAYIEKAQSYITKRAENLKDSNGNVISGDKLNKLLENADEKVLGAVGMMVASGQKINFKDLSATLEQSRLVGQFEEFYQKGGKFEKLNFEGDLEKFKKDNNLGGTKAENLQTYYLSKIVELMQTQNTNTSRDGNYGLHPSGDK